MASGLISALIAVWLRYMKKLDIPDTAFWVISGICLAGALFFAWRDEHQALSRVQRELEDLRNPQLVGAFQGSAIGLIAEHHNDSIITVFVQVTNLGAPSIVSEWKLSIALPGEKDPRLALPVAQPSGTITLEREEGPPVILSGEDDLADKTSQEPIPKGGARVGVLIFLLEGIPGTTLRAKQITLILTFKDVVGREYRILHERTGIPGSPPYVPGLKKPKPK